MKASIFRILRNVLLIAAILTSGFVLFVLLSGTKGFAVESDSMEPQIRRGDVVFVRPVAFEKLREGDVISATFPESGGVFTHRIISVDAQKKQVYTRGDHNLSDDPMPTEASHILGKLWFSVPLLGFLSLRVGNTLIYILLGVAIVLVAIRLLISFRKKTDNRGA